MIRALRTFPLLDGFRGAPPADLGALEDVVVRVGALAAAHPEIAELDLNPVIASPDRRGRRRRARARRAARRAARRTRRSAADGAATAAATREGRSCDARRSLGRGERRLKDRWGPEPRQSFNRRGHPGATQSIG